jgi:hypothetical protein
LLLVVRKKAEYKEQEACPIYCCKAMTLKHMFWYRKKQRDHERRENSGLELFPGCESLA